MTTTFGFLHRWSVAATLVLIGVFVLGATAVRFAPPGSSVAVWWPAAGLGVAFLLATGPDRRRALIVVAGVVVFSGAANLYGGRPPFTAACFGVANATEALVVWWLMTRGGRRPRLASLEDLGRLLVATLAGAVVFGVLAGLTVAFTLHGTFVPTAYTVAASHAAAVLTIAPLGVAVSTRRSERRRLEDLFQWLGLLAVAVWVFWSTNGLPLAFLPLPLLVWGATRQSLRTLAVQLSGLGVLVVVLTSDGGGPFAAAGRSGAVEPETVGALTQAFLVTAAVTGLALAVASTQRRDALAELFREAAFTQTVLNSAPATAIIGTDSSGTITLFNRGATNLLGFPPEDVVGSMNWVELHDPAEVACRAEELGLDPGPAVLVHVLEDAERTETRDWTWVTRDGRHMVVDLTTSAIVDEAGAVTGYIGVAEDVTERRVAADAVQAALDRERRAVEELTALDRAKTDFLSSVSHELRTPLASVLGYTEMLEDGAAGELSQKQLDLVSRIDRNGRRLLALIEDLLLNSRIESGQLHLARRPCDLAEIVDHAWESTGALVQKRELHLRREVSGEPVPLDGDATALERVVTNLLSNAVKFTPDGGVVTLALGRTEDGNGAGMARLVVSDSGYGISEEDQHQVFRRFFRSSDATDRAVQGTGLGLSIVQAIVEGHDGTIDVESTLGEGSTFTVLLPLATVAAPRSGTG
ncbi:ATP-binding protein [Pedococcus bigeumensis]|uniref:sensor histidine kinase n=1 Tax=Pedococcus bigeumensis TaxID=433644 RepID=UPI0013875F60|nr:ATP-binding protein [Pedococcus bigeumensis]